MNVLVINGSPRGENSNTIKLTRCFLEGTGWKDAEIINIIKLNIKPCLGCFACWNKTPGKCVINDDMPAILQKIISADVIIWSFPLYYFGVPGNLKNLIDRQLPLNLPFMSSTSESGGHPSRYDFTRQRHIVISTCGFWTAKGNYDGVTAMFDHLCGGKRYTSIFCGQGELFRVPELRNRTEEYLDIVRRAGAEYTEGGISEDLFSELLEPLYPREAFEKMADASWGISEGADKISDESLNFTKQMSSLYKPDGIRRVLEFFYTDIEKTYQILLDKNGAQVITNDFQPYTTRIETPFLVWRSIARGEISGSEAMFKQQYKVLGDFNLMLKWDDLFGGSATKKAATKPQEAQHKTNMTVLLLPWLIIWVLAAINVMIGGIAGIIVTAVIPLLWIFFKPVIFEQISISIVAGLSLMLILGADSRIIISASYGAFGLMWLIGAFTRIPLTAYYSAENYGNSKAFENLLFIRTNRILTASWGVLYLITSVWTYFLGGTGLFKYTGLINSVCPILMGLFTFWFQKWYPAYWARR